MRSCGLGCFLPEYLCSDLDFCPVLKNEGNFTIFVDDCLFNHNSPDPIPYKQCEMCGKEKIRYVHLLKHPDYDGEIRVGCDCASKMLCDYVTPQDRERNLKNRVNRRKNFMKQEWYRKPETGNYTLRYKGDYITIMKSKFGPGWGIIYKGQQQWEYHGRKITDFDTARAVAFNLFDELHESRHQEQPYWYGDRWIYV